MNPNQANMIPVRPLMGQPVFYPGMNPYAAPPPSTGPIYFQPTAVNQRMTFQPHTYQPVQQQGTTSPHQPVYQTGYQSPQLQQGPVNQTYSPTSQSIRQSVIVVTTQGSPVADLRPSSPMSPRVQSNLHRQTPPHTGSPLSRSTDTGKPSPGMQTPPSLSNGFIAAYKDDQSFFTFGKPEESKKAKTAEEIFKAKASHYGINITTDTGKLKETANKVSKQLESHKATNIKELRDTAKDFMAKASQYGIKIESPNSLVDKKQKPEITKMASEIGMKVKSLVPYDLDSEDFPSLSRNDAIDKQSNGETERLSEEGKLDTSIELKQDFYICYGDDNADEDMEDGIENNQVLETSKNSKFAQMLSAIRKTNYGHNQDYDDLSTPELQSPRDNPLKDDWQNFDDVDEVNKHDGSSDDDGSIFSDDNHEPDVSDHNKYDEPDDETTIKELVEQMVENVVSSALLELKQEYLCQKAKEKEMDKGEKSLYSWKGNRKKRKSLEGSVDDLSSQKSQSDNGSNPGSRRSSLVEADHISSIPVHISGSRKNSLVELSGSDKGKWSSIESIELNPHSPEFKPSGMRYAAKNKQSTLKPDVPEFIPMYVPKNQNQENFGTCQKEQYQALEGFGRSHVPFIEHSETQTEMPDVSDKTTNTKQTKMCDREMETLGSDMRDIVVNTVESMFDQDSQFFIDDNTEEVDHGHLDACVQTDENEQWLKNKLICAQRELLQARCYTCRQKLEQEMQYIRNSKYQMYSVFSNVGDRSRITDVIDGRILCIKGEIHRLERKLNQYEEQLNEGLVFDTVPDFGLKLDTDEMIRSQVSMECKDIQTDNEAEDEEFLWRQLTSEIMRKILHKVDKSHSTGTKLFDLVSRVKDMLNTVMLDQEKRGSEACSDNSGKKLTYDASASNSESSIIEAAEQKLDALFTNPKAIKVSQDALKSADKPFDLDNSIDEKIEKARVLLETLQSSNIPEISEENILEEDKENIEKKENIKSKKSKKGKKKNKNDQDKSENRSDLDTVIKSESKSSIDSTLIESESRAYLDVTSVKKELNNNLEESSFEPESMTCTSTQNEETAKVLCMDKSSSQTQVDDQSEEIGSSSKTTVEVYHSLEDIDDEDYDLDLSVSRHSLSSDYASAASELSVQRQSPVCASQSEESKASSSSATPQNKNIEFLKSECHQNQTEDVISVASSTISECSQPECSKTDIDDTLRNSGNDSAIDKKSDEVKKETESQSSIGQNALTSSSLYTAVLNQLKQFYPHLANNPVVLNAVAAQQTQVLQIYLNQSGQTNQGQGHGDQQVTANQMQALGHTANQMQTIGLPANPMAGIKMSTSQPNQSQVSGLLANQAPGFGTTNIKTNPMLGQVGGQTAHTPQAQANLGQIGTMPIQTLASQVQGPPLMRIPVVPVQNPTLIPAANQIPGFGLPNQRSGFISYQNPIIEARSPSFSNTQGFPAFQTNPPNVIPVSVMFSTNIPTIQRTKSPVFGIAGDAVPKTTGFQSGNFNSNCLSSKDDIQNEASKVDDSIKSKVNRFLNSSNANMSPVASKASNLENSDSFKSKVDRFLKSSNETISPVTNKAEKSDNPETFRNKVDRFLNSSNDTMSPARSLSSSIIDNGTLMSKMKPPGFGGVNDYSVDVIKSNTPLADSVAPTKPGLNHQSMKSSASDSKVSSSIGNQNNNNDSKMDQSKKSGFGSCPPKPLTVPTKDVMSKGTMQQKPQPVLNLPEPPKGTSQPKPLEVPTANFSFSKTLTHNLPPQSDSKSNGTSNSQGNIQKPPLRKPTDLPGLSTSGTLHGKLSGFDSNSPSPTDAEKAINIPQQKFNGPTNLLPRLQKKRQSTENERKRYKSESWDDEVDDFAEPFVLHHDVNKPIQSHVAPSAVDALEDIPLPEKVKKEDSENKEEEEEEWCQVTKKKKKEMKSTEVKKPAASNKKRHPSEKSAKSNNFDRLVAMLMEVHTGLSRSQVIDVISEVRAVRNGLSGLTVKEILEIARTVVIRKYEHKMTNNQRPLTQSSGLMTDRRRAELQEILLGNPDGSLDTPEERAARMKAFNAMKSHQAFKSSGAKSLDDEDDICVICHDELTVGETKVLDCKHEFHTQCISKWVYERERTCPTCRGHALFEDEFPKLGS